MITSEVVVGTWDGLKAMVGGPEGSTGGVGAEEVGYARGCQASKSFKDKQQDLKIDSVLHWKPA